MMVRLTKKPPKPLYSTPADNPSLPGTFDVFNPSLVDSSYNNSPTIANATHEGKPLYTIAVACDGITANTTYDAYGQVSATNWGMGGCTKLDSCDNGSVILLPGSLPSNSMYLVWPKNSSNTIGRPFKVNGTRLDWLSVTKNAVQYELPGVVAVGETCTVKGRNLLGVDATNLIYIDGHGWVTATYNDKYCAEFTVPTLATPGTSATSNTPGTGSKSFTTQSSLGYVAGQPIAVQPAIGNFSHPAGTYMKGTVTSYSGTSLVVDVTEFAGSGTGQPWNIFPGYNVWAHNGHGGVYGWGGPLQLYVAPAYDYTAGGIFNLSDYSPPASPGDCLAALNAAIAAAAATGLPSTIRTGTRTVDLSALPNNFTGGGSTGIHLEGNGPSNSILKPISGFFAANFLVSSTGKSKISGIKIDFANGTLTGTDALVEFANAENMEITDLRYNPLNWDGPAWVENCDLTGGYNNTSMCFNNSATDVTYKDCNFYECNQVGGAITLGFANRVSVTGCTFQDYNTNGTNAERGSGRALVMTSPAMNVYFRGNTTITLAVPETPEPDQNQGEQVLVDGGLSSFSGNAASATANTVTLASSSSAWVGRTIAITGGKGTGQWARITAVDTGTHTLTLDRDFTLVLDTTSRVSVCATAANIVIYNNTLQGKSNFQGASMAWEFFGGALDCAVDTNTCSDFNFGGTNWAAGDTVTGGPVFFGAVQNNTFTGCNRGHRFVDGGPATGETYSFFGHVYRDNAHSTSGVASLYLHKITSGTELTVFDHTTWTDANDGIVDNSNPTAGTLVFNASSFSLGDGTFSGSVDYNSNGVAYVFNDTTFTGFEN